jgi:hypothetical protein
MLYRARIRVTGHMNYFAVTDNSDKCSSYVYHATKILFKWINRKSQRRSYTWERFNQALEWFGWPKPSIRKDLNPCRRLQAIWKVNRRAGCMGNPLVRFWEGLGTTAGMAKIWWHRRETRRKRRKQTLVWSHGRPQSTRHYLIFCINTHDKNLVLPPVI